MPNVRSKKCSSFLFLVKCTRRDVIFEFEFQQPCDIMKIFSFLLCNVAKMYAVTCGACLNLKWSKTAVITQSVSCTASVMCLTKQTRLQTIAIGTY